MKLFGLNIGKTETRASPEDPRVPVSAANFLQFFNVNTYGLPAVTLDAALTVPAVSASVSFLSRSLANLPLHAYRDAGDAGAVRTGGKLQRVLNEAPNTEWTSFGFRQYFWQQVFTGGRGLAWIERIGPNVDAIWPIDSTRATVKRVNGRKIYTVDNREYPAADVIDVPFMLKSDQLAVHSPLVMGAKAISLAIAMGDYASGFFAGGGVPPLALTGPMPAGADAIKRAQADIKRSIDAAKSGSDAIFPIPAGYELKPVGFDPAKGQMTEARRLQIEEIARLFNLPPVFVQDLTHGTFSNTEQQDLHLVKHLIAQWAKALEEELNLKLFGAANNRRYVEHSLDAMMRGDFATRMAGMAQGIQTAILTPNEARTLDNRPPLANGDVLYIQGATVPLGYQTMDEASSPADEGGADEPRDPDTDSDA
jgi:HK97 family phage portal protein